MWWTSEAVKWCLAIHSDLITISLCHRTPFWYYYVLSLMQSLAHDSWVSSFQTKNVYIDTDVHFYIIIDLKWCSYWGSSLDTLWCTILFASEILICIFSTVWIYLHTSPNTNVYCNFVLGLQWEKWFMTWHKDTEKHWFDFAHCIMIPCKIRASVCSLPTAAMMLIRLENNWRHQFSVWCSWLLAFLGSISLWGI